MKRGSIVVEVDEPVESSSCATISVDDSIMNMHERSLKHKKTFSQHFVVRRLDRETVFKDAAVLKGQGGDSFRSYMTQSDGSDKDVVEVDSNYKQEDDECVFLNKSPLKREYTYKNNVLERVRHDEDGYPFARSFVGTRADFKHVAAK